MSRRTLRIDPLGLTTRSGWFRRPAEWNHASQTLTLASGRVVPYRHVRIRLIHPRRPPMPFNWLVLLLFDLIPRLHVLAFGKEVQVAMADEAWLRLHKSRRYPRLMHELRRNGVKVDMADTYVPAPTFQATERHFRPTSAY
ncbi:MAG: hypothetical protein O3C27_05440 [Actinomycetota bacterium]|nr:hypothetical protein [Actinomycetota bacterium]